MRSVHGSGFSMIDVGISLTTLYKAPKDMTLTQLIVNDLEISIKARDPIK
jgi:hypothetical protein